MNSVKNSPMLYKHFYVTKSAGISLLCFEEYCVLYNNSLEILSRPYQIYNYIANNTVPVLAQMLTNYISDPHFYDTVTMWADIKLRNGTKQRIM